MGEGGYLCDPPKQKVSVTVVDVKFQCGGKRLLYNTLLKRRREVATAVARAMDRNRAAINKEGPQTYFDDLEHCISHN